ncbi:LLM class flavin-dependent oxidoreductase [Streptomyces sp. ISL-12]|uniref:LLM class flavin-dependent oxidoreductase n=1 Tax=Streptomyces sp. ISL-12 TaxID=2819177 RepID=UPI001BEBD743|nr:LLM class flavin-dependent oxidoreductase [Streptomyces sp. ISL-12]MBT2409920.1 LLM class flavin-dependent oxidoreductase [Streptomyces sp. ISL-12]
MTADGGVRFGVLLTTDRYPGQTDSEVLARTVAVARGAEALGLDDVWLTEHHFLDSAVNPSALALAAYLLGRTERVHVGTAVTVLPLHSPVHTAEQAALLDQVSGGRFVLGVGRGVPGVEYEVLGGGIGDWRAGLGRPLDRLLDALRGEVPTGLAAPAPPSVRPLPAARTSPHPPVYVAAGSPASIELAADRGLPLMLFFDKSAEAKAEMVALHARRVRATGAGAPVGGHAFAVFTRVTGSPREAERLMRDRARFILALNQHRGLPPDPSLPAAPPVTEEHVATLAGRILAHHPVGPVETCVERLAHHIGVSGCTRVMCQVEGAEGTDETLAHLERLATRVFPAVRRRVGSRPAPAAR